MTNGDTGIDRLYQLPLDEFTARAQRAGEGVEEAARPSRRWPSRRSRRGRSTSCIGATRRAWDALVAAADNQRRVNKAVLAGREGDVRAAGEVHDEAVQEALKATLDICSRATATR